MLDVGKCPHNSFTVKIFFFFGPYIYSNIVYRQPFYSFCLTFQLFPSGFLVNTRVRHNIANMQGPRRGGFVIDEKTQTELVLEFSLCLIKSN